MPGALQTPGNIENVQNQGLLPFWLDPTYLSTILQAQQQLQAQKQQQPQLVVINQSSPPAVSTSCGPRGCVAAAGTGSVSTTSSQQGTSSFIGQFNDPAQSNSPAQATVRPNRPFSGGRPVQGSSNRPLSGGRPGQSGSNRPVSSGSGRPIQPNQTTGRPVITTTTGRPIVTTTTITPSQGTDGSESGKLIILWVGKLPLLVRLTPFLKVDPHNNTSPL